MKSQSKFRISFVQTPETIIRGELIKSQNKSVVTEKESTPISRLLCHTPDHRFVGELANVFV